MIFLEANGVVALDHSLFHWVNSELSNRFFDYFMPIAREKTTWIPLYAFLLWYIFKTLGWRKGLIVVLGSLAVFGLGDYLSSSVIKPFFGRLRPCQNPDVISNMHLLISCGTGKSFTSSHATNHFGLAVFWSLFLAKGKYKTYIAAALLLWASLVSFAQIYVGVHFPFDVLGGAILGTCIALCVYFLCRYIISRWLTS
ncbi:MAG: phosphatase PAP2 family protein [Chitinophagales bacterium]|nr:phosphatase PAP2 family protein [Bacteroidota bacterium]MCB9043547.1 phosphatase PAP2 family protein [Chitinophagales bacterium]